MSVDLTRHSSSWTLVLFALLGALFCLRAAVAPGAEPAEIPAQMPLGVWVDSLGGGLPAWLSRGLVLLLVFWNGTLLTRILSRNMILLERSYLPYILYLLIACGPAFSSVSLAPYMAATLLVSAHNLMIDSFRRVIIYSKSFDAALLMGLAVLVYAPAVVYVPLLLCALVIFKKGWREWVSTSVALLLPMLAYSYVAWGLGGSFSRSWQTLSEALSGRLEGAFFWAQRPDPLLAAFGGLVILATLVSLALFFSRVGTMRTRPYKSCLYFVWVFLFSLALSLSPGASWSDLPLLGMAPALLMPIGLTRFGGWIANTVYLVLLGLVLLYNLLPLIGISF